MQFFVAIPWSVALDIIKLKVAIWVVTVFIVCAWMAVSAAGYDGVWVLPTIFACVFGCVMVGVIAYARSITLEERACRARVLANLEAVSNARMARM